MIEKSQKKQGMFICNNTYNFQTHCRINRHKYTISYDFFLILNEFERFTITETIPKGLVVNRKWATEKCKINGPKYIGRLSIDTGKTYRPPHIYTTL